MVSSSGGSSLQHLQNLSTSIEVRTLPQGLPEPPVDVEVEPGTREGVAVVSWLPVTINPSGTSNGAPVIGYEVMADGVKVAQVNSSTADQLVVELPRKEAR